MVVSLYALEEDSGLISWSSSLYRDSLIVELVSILGLDVEGDLLLSFRCNKKGHRSRQC